MCGFAGVLGLEGGISSNVISEVFVESLKHRGPNAHGTYIDSEILLTHVRLSIIDIDDRSNQPFKSKDGRYVLVFNGELYNYKEIKTELSEFHFSTDSDTEVLLAAWIKWGVDCIRRFNGMFAFALWDKQKEELVLCRDRLGIKPLYYYQGHQNFIFSSEIRAMLNTGIVPRKLASENLSEFLKYQTVHCPRTLVEDVYQVKPGHFIKIVGEQLEDITYWRPEDNFLDSGKSTLKIVQNEISKKLTESVEKRLISDVPLGAFLSGGIDSSLIVGIISDRLNKKVDTFSVTFGEKEFSEAPFSQLVAKRFKTNHHELELNPDDFMGAIPLALDATDHPSGDGPNSYVVSEAVKKAGLTVALSGLGGDELFAGYPFFSRYLELKKKSFLLSFPKYTRELGAYLLKLKIKGIQGQKIAETLTLPYFDIPHTYPINRRVLGDSDIAKLLVTHSYSDALFIDLKHRFEFGEASNSLSELSKVSLAEISTYMQNVLLRDTDQMSMAHALEVRVPFLDHNVVELVMGIGDEYKTPQFAKSLLVNSFDDLLPNEVVHRPKMGFVLPWEHWLKNELRDLCTLSLDYLEHTAYFKKNQVTQLYDRFLRGDNLVSWSRIWPLVSLGHWMKKNEIE